MQFSLEIVLPLSATTIDSLPCFMEMVLKQTSLPEAALYNYTYLLIIYIY